MTDWTVRRATPGDAAVIAAHRYLGGEDAATLAAYARWVEFALRRDVYRGWLAEQQGEVIGGAGLTLLEWGPTRENPGPWRARVVNVFTEPAWRGQGVASALLERCLADASASGIVRLSLGTTPQARGLYERFGFVPVTTEMTRRDSSH